ncbi:hypothetical protein [Maribacter sp. 2304DJ31-5]|uniref:hypothetical protein n=1 Tax=Maribacter sp. 2304DJ31-5 TaxID=3386273 RepID=UPI0039BC9BDB
MEQGKLTKEDIQSVDTYLKNSDALYIDVRMEMVDHVATAVEADMLENGKTFYNAFKDYMIQHKRGLLSGYEKLRKKKQRQSLSMLWPYLKRPWSLGLFLILWILTHNFNNWFGITFPYVSFVWGCLLLAMGIYYFSMVPPKKYRFSYLEALGWGLFLMSYVAQFLFQFWSANALYKKIYPPLISVFVAAFGVCCLAFILAFFERKKYYVKKYQLA